MEGEVGAGGRAALREVQAGSVSPGREAPGKPVTATAPASLAPPEAEDADEVRLGEGVSSGDEGTHQTTVAHPLADRETSVGLAPPEVVRRSADFGAHPGAQAAGQWAGRAAAVARSIDLGRRGWGGRARGPGRRSPGAVMGSGSEPELSDVELPPMCGSGRASVRASGGFGVGNGGGGGHAERMFQREVIGVHSEIDKLLGGLRGELETWRNDFDSLQTFWFMNVAEQPPVGEAPGFQSLVEFQQALERHIEDVDADLQVLEERLHAVDSDRGDLMDLLEDGRREVARMEGEIVEMKRETESRVRGDETAAAKTQAQIKTLSDAALAEKEKAIEASALAKDEAERASSFEAQLSEQTMELSVANNRTKQLEGLLGETKAALAEKVERLTSSDMDARRLKALLEARSDECERKQQELSAKVAELSLAEEAIGQRDSWLQEHKENVEGTRKDYLEVKDALQSQQLRAMEMEEQISKAAAESKAAAAAKLAAARENAALQKQLLLVTNAGDGLREELETLRGSNEMLADELDAMRQECSKLQGERNTNRAAIAALRQAEAELCHKIDSMQEKGREDTSLNDHLREQVATLQNLLSRRTTEMEQSRESSEAKLKRVMQESEASRAELEENLKSYFQGMLQEAEAHTKAMEEERKKVLETELSRIRTAETERRRRDKEEHEAALDSIRDTHDSQLRDTKSSAAEQLREREKALLEERRAALSAFQDKFEEAQRMHAEELSNITSSHRTQMLEFEAKQRSKSEKVIRELRQEAEREMKKMREKLASESELMQDRILGLERQLSTTNAAAAEAAEKALAELICLRGENEKLSQDLGDTNVQLQDSVSSQKVLRSAQEAAEADRREARLEAERAYKAKEEFTRAKEIQFRQKMASCDEALTTALEEAQAQIRAKASEMFSMSP